MHLQFQVVYHLYNDAGEEITNWATGEASHDFSGDIVLAMGYTYYVEAVFSGYDGVGPVVLGRATSERVQFN